MAKNITTSELNHKLELWGMVDYDQKETGGTNRKPAKIKDIYCGIKELYGYNRNITGTNVGQTLSFQRIRCRKQSIKEPQIDMFFKDRNGLKYEIMEMTPSYEIRNNFWEFKTKIVRE